MLIVNGFVNMSTKSSVYGKYESKNGFLTLNAKKEVIKTIGIIAATNRLKHYEVIEMGIKAKFPEYFDSEWITRKLDDSLN